MVMLDIEESDLKNLLFKRVNFWIDGEVEANLFYDMYENYVDNGYFEGYKNFNVKDIVDNDINNYCGIIRIYDNRFEEIGELYEKNGLGDISSESQYYNYIEAVDNKINPTAFLVRKK